MRLSVNGRARDLPASSSVRDVLAATGIDPAQRGIAVAVDGQVVARADWAARRLSVDARVEVVRATAGG